VKFAWHNNAHCQISFSGRVATVQALVVELAKAGTAKLGSHVKPSVVRIDCKMKDASGKVRRERVTPRSSLASLCTVDSLLLTPLEPAVTRVGL
jgi:hypothetical protein